MFFLYYCACNYAQISTNEKPISFELNLHRNALDSVTPVILPSLDIEKLVSEDKEDEKYDLPPRFGYLHKVSLNLNNSGFWYKLPNGDKLWQLCVICPNALSVNFLYNQFWLPEGGKFFVFSKDKKHSIGAFTSKNNKGSRDEIRGFATGLIYGNEVILEYYQPKDVTLNAIISIEYVVHGYRYITLEEKGFGGSASCMVNVNCEEGENWQNEKAAVSLILVNGNRYCTGSLINTTDLGQEPYLLTANHCISGYGDATGSSNLDFYSFYWNYEAPGCVNTGVEPLPISTSGASILANNDFSDFALLKLTENPIDLSFFTPFYLGWDISGLCGDPGVCIHHPKGDVKKISTVFSQPSSSYWNNQPVNSNSHWMVEWASTLNGHGMTQGGSSGSPLLNAAHKVIGQLHGSNCRDCNNPEGRSYYGKFDVSWTGNNSNSVYRRLNCWLDSLSTGVQTMEGLLIIPTTRTCSADQQLYCNMRITNTGRLFVQSHIQMMGNCRVIVETGGKIIIDGGTLSNVNLVLEPGATLQILHGGIIETRNGFRAPVGAFVNVEQGKIL